MNFVQLHIKAARQLESTIQKVNLLLLQAPGVLEGTSSRSLLPGHHG